MGRDRMFQAVAFPVQIVFRVSVRVSDVGPKQRFLFVFFFAVFLGTVLVL